MRPPSRRELRARRLAFDAQPQAEQDAIRARLAWLLGEARWTWSRDRSHEWSEKTESGWDVQDFVWCVETIRTLGRIQHFRQSDYLVCDVGAHFYWTMGNPVEQTRILNRRRREDEPVVARPLFDSDNDNAE